MDGSSKLLRAIRRARRREITGRLADAWLYSAITVTVIFLIEILESNWYAPLPLAALTLVALAIVVGVTHFLSPRLDVLSIARRLDDRNRTSDLLATAVTVSRPDEAWSRSILAHAEHATTNLAYPRPLGRHSLRAHLAAGAMVVAMALVSVLLTPDARPDTNVGPAQFASIDGYDPSDPSRIGSSFRKPGEAESQTPFNIADDETASTTGNASPDNPQANPADGSGEGTSSAGVEATLATDHPRHQTPPHTAQHTATGSGTESRASTATRTASAAGTSDTAARNATAPWQTDGWTAARDRALESMSSMHLPQDRRALVRAYFDR